MPQLISIGQILDHGWNHYIKNFNALMKISAWYLLIIAFMIIGTIMLPVKDFDFLLDQGLLGFIAMPGFVILILSSLIIVPVITIWATMSLITLVDSQFKKRAIDIKTISNKSWKNFFSYIWISILGALVMLVPMLLVLPGIGLIVLNLATDGGVWLGVLSILLTLVGGIVALIVLFMLSIQLNFWTYNFMVDGVRGSGALKASYALVKGRFWKTFVRIFIPSLALALATSVIQGIASGAISFSIALSPLPSDLAFYITMIFNNIISYGMLALIAPLYVIIGYVLFDSLKQNPVK